MNSSIRMAYRKVQKDSGGYGGRVGGKLAPLLAKGFGAYMASEDDPGASYSPLDSDSETDGGKMIVVF